jgi:hypothetical protein
MKLPERQVQMNRLLVMSLTVIMLAWVAAARGGELLIESIDGPVTAKEIAAFKDYMQAMQYRPDNNHNNMVYGKIGNAAEAMGMMYETTGDRQILDQLIKLADLMLAARNHPQTGRILWTGNRELAWPNSPDSTDEYLYAGTENGDVIGHIVYPAKLILANQRLWNEKLADGTTYQDRAKTYVCECDRTIDTYLLVHFVDPKTNRYTFPTSPLYARLGDRAAKAMGKGVPWNQQMMLNNGFGRLAECHALLGDDPARVARYDAIVKTSCESFLASLVHYDVNGHDCVKWSYAADDPTLHYMEDTAHGGYDMLILRAWRSGRYGITKESLLPFANTAMYVIRREDGTYASKVNGTGTTAKTLRTTYLPLCQFVPELWPGAAKADLARAMHDPLLTATILSMKQWFWSQDHAVTPSTTRP